MVPVPAEHQHDHDSLYVLVLFSVEQLPGWMGLEAPGNASLGAGRIADPDMEHHTRQ